MGKRYYWLRLHDDFFDSKRIKKLRRIAGGDTYVIIYLKLQLKAMKTDGVIEYTGLEQTFADELALDLDENPDDVRVTLNYLLSTGLAETNNQETFFFPYAVDNVGSETAGAARVRACRERKNLAEQGKALQGNTEALQCNNSVTERREEKENRKRIDREEKTRARDPFAELIERENDEELTTALNAWFLELFNVGEPLTKEEQKAIVEKLSTIPRTEWLPAIRRSTEKRWRSVYPRKEDKKAAAQQKQRNAWNAPVPAEETERLIRLTREMEEGNG